MSLSFSEELYVLLQERIGRVKSGEVLVQAKAGLRLVKESLVRLERYYSDHPFADAFAERRYREVVLPQFMGLDFYYRELLWMEYNRPIGSDAELAWYYRQELGFIRHFFSRYAVQYHGYRIRFLELEADDLPEGLLMGELGDESLGGVSSVYSMDAKFMGYEQLLSTTLGRLQVYEQLGDGVVADFCVPVKAGGTGLQWTGKLCNLVELVYGLYESRQINNGVLPIAVLIRWLEESLQVDLKSVYSIYDDVKSRKRISPVCFLQDMRTALKDRIVSDLGYTPDSFKIGL